MSCPASRRDSRIVRCRTAWELFCSAWAVTRNTHIRLRSFSVVTPAGGSYGMRSEKAEASFPIHRSIRLNYFLFDAFSSRQPVSTSLENALGSLLASEIEVIDTGDRRCARYDPRRRTVGPPSQRVFVFAQKSPIAHKRLPRHHGQRRARVVPRQQQSGEQVRPRTGETDATHVESGYVGAKPRGDPANIIPPDYRGSRAGRHDEH